MEVNDLEEIVEALQSARQDGELLRKLSGVSDRLKDLAQAKSLDGAPFWVQDGCEVLYAFA